MWTLHKLKSSKRSRSTAGVDSPPSDLGRESHNGEGVDDIPAPAPSLPLPPSQPHIASPWDFSQEELRMFPALCKRNFWCVQRHQARGACPFFLCHGSR